MIYKDFCNDFYTHTLEFIIKEHQPFNISDYYVEKVWVTVGAWNHWSTIEVIDIVTDMSIYANSNLKTEDNYDKAEKILKELFGIYI